MNEDDMIREIRRMLSECQDKTQIAMIYHFVSGMIQKRSGL